MEGLGLLVGHLLGDYILQDDWMARHKTSVSFICFLHCLLYTWAVWACSFWWMPLWGLAVCLAVHFPIDRWCLAKKWMDNVSGQSAFASGPLAPWSIVVVDNTFHVLTLFIIGLVHFGAV